MLSSTTDIIESSAWWDGVYVTCLHEHESASLTSHSSLPKGSPDPIMCHIQTCVLMMLWDNYLCPHTSLGNDTAIDGGAFNRLMKRISRLDDWEHSFHLKSDIRVIHSFKSFLDRLMRFSYVWWSMFPILWELPKHREQETISKYIMEMKEMLLRRKYNPLPILNAWERIRFNFLMKKIQIYEIDIIEDILSRLQK